MDEKIVIDRFVKQVKDYAKGKKHDVARGAESPRLAALLLQKYGLGIVDAVSLRGGYYVTKGNNNYYCSRTWA